MVTSYATDKLTAAIKNHLLTVDAISRTAEASKLASDLAQVCLRVLYSAGLGREAIEHLFAPAAFKAKVRGVV
jgi:hypothetical protein